MVKPRTVLDLFSGIGGFSLGLEWTGGYQTVGFCEACPKARKILAKRWPGVPIFEDVRTLTKETIDDDCGTIDVVCGGFPCQDISLAGKGEGLEGKRSGLWFEMLRIIDATRPRYVIAENVSALRSRGLDRVLGSLAEIGYDAEWHCIPASAVGAPHRRDRVWIIAFPNADRDGESALPVHAEVAVASEPLADCSSHRWIKRNENAGRCETRSGKREEHRLGNCGQDVADAEGRANRNEREDDRKTCREINALVYPCCSGGRIDRPDDREVMAYADRPGCVEQRRPEPVLAELPAVECGGWWSSEPDVGRVAHGVPGRVDRLKQLGNAVVPHIPYLIGKALLSRW